MFSWPHKKKDPVTTIRQWNVGDIPHIMRLVSQNPESGWGYEYDDWRKWMTDKCYYGIVVVEDYAIQGCATVFVTKSQRAHIGLFQVDIKHRRKGFGTHMMHHLFLKIREWNNKTLCREVNDTDTNAHLFLASKNIGFVATHIHEFYDGDTEPNATVYTMEYPPPWGFRKGTIQISKDNKETTQSFPQTPDPA